MKEQDQSTPGSGDGSIKMEPPAIKEEPGGSTEHIDDKKDLLLHNKQNGHPDDSVPDIKPKLEELTATPSSLPGGDGEAHTPLNNLSQQQNTPQDGQATPSSQPVGSNAPHTPLVNTPGPMPPMSQGMPPQNLGQPTTSMESHFMQQQSQIFVFSTSLANKAADAVHHGQCKTIIDYHMEQPGTKQFLQKHPLKVSQFNRGPMMYNNGSGMPPRTGAGARMPEGNNPMTSVAQWVQQQNASMHLGPGPGHSPPFSPNSFSQAGGMPPPNSSMGWQGPMGPQPSGPGMGPGSEFEMMMEGQFVNNMPPGSQGNLLQNKVPNENLTPEQLQRREEQLASLQKIKQMLFPDQGMNPNGPGGLGMGMMHGPNQGPGPGPGPGPGVGNGFPPMSQSGPGPGPGPGPGGMMPQHGMRDMPPNMMGSPPDMMGNNPMGGMPGMPIGPGLPPNWDTMTPAQREWFKLQQDFYQDKRRKQQMQHMQQMHMGPGPPPPYFGMRRGGMPPGPMSPTSPNMCGPMGSMRGPSPHPNDPMMMPGPRRPGHVGMNMPGGPPGPNFELAMDGPGSMFPFKDDMLRPPGPGGKLPMIQRAGNPEQFVPESLGPPTPTSNSGPSKPPPPYGQAQKRKRSGDDLDELYKKLQPAPSPQQFSYLNQFEGQELTITKQLNMAYQEPGAPSPANQNTAGRSPSTHSHPPSTKESAVASPLPITSSTALTNIASPLPTSTPSSRPSSVSGHGPSSVGQHGPSSVGQHGPNSVGQHGPNSVGQHGGPSSVSSNASVTPHSGAGNQRLSHFDVLGPNSSSVNTVSNVMTTANSKQKNTMSNITSASLANLAKDVEHLSNQMQQNMMQGGPFHNIQVQGQMSDGGEHSPAGSDPKCMGQGPPGSQSSHSQQPSPSVNNTFVNATMSIGQLNIQTVNQPSGGQPGGYGSMQVQQMNSDSMNSMSGPMGGNGGPMGGNGGPMSGNGGPMGGNNGPIGSGGPLPPSGGPISGPMNSGGGPMPGPVGNTSQMNSNGGPMVPMSGAHMGPGNNGPMMGMNGDGPPMGMKFGPNMPGGNGPPMGGPPMSMSGPGFTGRHPSPGLNSPGYNPQSSSAGPPMPNANVQIQAKAPNTIQYLPANPPSSQAGAMPMNRKEMEMMSPRFPSPTPMDGGRSSANKFPFGPALDMIPMGMNGPPGPRMNQPMSMHQSMMMQNNSMQQSMSRMMTFNGPNGMGGMGPNMGPGMGPGPGHMMGGDMMQGQVQMQSQQMNMHGPGPMMPGMGPGPGMHPGDGGPVGPGGQSSSNYSAQFQQFQQQLYAQGRPRQMNPNHSGAGGGGAGGGGGMGAGPGGQMMQGPGPDMMMPGGMGGPGPGPGNMGGPGPGGMGGPGPGGMGGPGPGNMGGPGPGGMGMGPPNMMGSGPGPNMMNSGGVMPNML